MLRGQAPNRCRVRGSSQPGYAAPVRVHVEVLNELGEVRESHTVEAPVVTVGGGSLDTLRIEELPGEALHILVEPSGVWVRTGRAEVAVRETTTFRVTEALALRITPYPRDAGAAVRGGCPRCGEGLRDRAVGGAYRTIARREQGCPRCGATVIELEDAARTLGAFADLSQTDWVAVVVPVRCPRCATTMRRSVFRTACGNAEVERCAECGVVVLDPDDRARLTGEA